MQHTILYLLLTQAQQTLHVKHLPTLPACHTRQVAAVPTALFMQDKQAGVSHPHFIASTDYTSENTSMRYVPTSNTTHVPTNSSTNKWSPRHTVKQTNDQL